MNGKNYYGVSEMSALRLRIAELEAARSMALTLLKEVMPVVWTEDWDADKVRRNLEWAIRFCGGEPPRKVNDEINRP